jgi:hypothetical protein
MKIVLIFLILAPIISANGEDVIDLGATTVESSIRHSSGQITENPLKLQKMAKKIINSDFEKLEEEILSKLALKSFKVGK